MLCKKCGTELKVGNAFCTMCGTPVSAVPKETGRRICKCGNVVADGLLFCTQCGRKYEESPPASQKAPSTVKNTVNKTTKPVSKKKLFTVLGSLAAAVAIITTVTIVSNMSNNVDIGSDGNDGDRRSSSGESDEKNGKRKEPGLIGEWVDVHYDNKFIFYSNGLFVALTAGKESSGEYAVSGNSLTLNRYYGLTIA